MRISRHGIHALVLLLVGVFATTTAACGSSDPSPPTNPLGGPINTGGKPDVDKSHGTVGAGGDANTGGKPDPSKTNTSGAPDVNKSTGTISTGGPINTSGLPFANKDAGK